MIGFIVYAAWCGFCWRLRGGLISNVTRELFGVTLSTGVTRVACAALMALPLWAVNPWLVLLAGSIYAAMTLPYFDRSMGLEQRSDYLWMAGWGVAVSAVMVAPVAAWTLSPTTFALSGLGAFAVAAYAGCKALGGNWTERAEWLVGCLFGAILWAACLA